MLLDYSGITPRSLIVRALNVFGVLADDEAKLCAS